MNIYTQYYWKSFDCDIFTLAQTVITKKYKTEDTEVEANLGYNEGPNSEN